MEKISEITIKQKPFKKGIFTGLNLNIKGKNVDYTLVNTIRRVIMTDVPIYIFNKINITKNTSVYHNDYLSLRIKNISIKVPNDNVFFEEKIQEKQEIKTYEDKMLDDNIKNVVGEDDIDMEDSGKIDEKLFKEITMYLKYHNNTDKIVSVTTNDCKFYQNGNEFKNPFEYPVIIVDLQPKQIIELSAITELGIEKQTSLFSPVSRVGYKQISDNEFDMVINSNGQLTEKRIVFIACENIKKQLKELLDLIPDIDDSKGIFEIHDIDHTLGNLTTNGMLKHNDVSFCSYNMVHYLDNKVQIKYELKKGKFKSIFKEVVDYYVKLFDSVKKNFE